MSIKMSLFVLFAATSTVIAPPIKFITADEFLKKWDAQKRETDLYQLVCQALVFPDQLIPHLDRVVNSVQPNHIPLELRKLIAAYALVPLDELLSTIVTPERMRQWESEGKQLDEDVMGLCTRYGQERFEYNALLAQHEMRVSISSEVLDLWRQAGFEFRVTQGSLFKMCALRCARCGDAQRTFGIVMGMCSWRRPQYYHSSCCKMLVELVQQPEYRLQTYGDQVPASPEDFFAHALLQLDVYARKVSERDPHEKTTMGEKANVWLRQLVLYTSELPALREAALYFKYPKAWIEKENKLRDQEHQIELPARLRPGEAVAPAK